MSKIAEAIGSIVLKKLNGELLKIAQNGAPIPAKVGVGLGGSASGPSVTLGDEVFTEYARSTVKTNVYSTDDPELYVEVTQPVKIKLKSKEGRGIELNLKEPVQEGP